MPEKKKDDNKKTDRFTIWIYIGFGILGLLLLILIIGLLFYLFSSSKPSMNTGTSSIPKSSSSIPSMNTGTSSIPKSSSSIPMVSTDTNTRSKYMTSLFRYGGFRNRYKRF